MDFTEYLDRYNIGTANQSIADRLKEVERKSPYYQLFIAYKNQPLTNPLFKKYYYEEGVNGHYETPDGVRSDQRDTVGWEEEILKAHFLEEDTGERQLHWVDDGREAPPDATKYDILTFIEGFFEIGENTTKADLDTLKEDYPDLYEVVVAEVQAIKGLGIDKIKPSDYDKPLISYKTLYELNIEYYKEFFRFNPKDGNAFIATFISVIPEEEISQWGSYIKQKYIDEQGNYKHQFQDYDRKHITESTPLLIERVKDHLRYLGAIQELYKLLGEQLGEQSIIDLAKDENYFFGEKDRGYKYRRSYVNQLLEFINGDIEDLRRGLRKTSPVISRNTIKDVTNAVNTLKIINRLELKPTPEAIVKVKELTKDLSFYGQRGLHLHDILMGES